MGGVDLDQFAALRTPEGSAVLAAATGWPAVIRWSRRRRCGHAGCRPGWPPPR